MKIPRTAHECAQALGCVAFLIDERNVERLAAWLERNANESARAPREEKV